MRSEVLSSLESITTGICLKSSLSLRYARNSSPRISGMRMSEIIRSGMFPRESHSMACGGFCM